MGTPRWHNRAVWEALISISEVLQSGIPPQDQLDDIARHVDKALREIATVHDHLPTDTDYYANLSADTEEEENT